MAAELSSAPLLSTCTQHRRLFQLRRNSLFHCPTLPLPLSPSLSASPLSSSTAAARAKVLCQTAGTHLVDAAEAGQNRLLKVPIPHIRNFCIIAHIDHGKSTLADKLLQMTGTVQTREMKEQFLDNMDLERERGITIKLQAARMRYMYKNEAYCLNLIDTPGHVDFSYEVSRSLAACEGALLVVDASQGVEAQTLANVYLALESNLEIIPVLNKIDLPGADPHRVTKEIEEIVGLDCSNAIQCSAKEGIGITEILNAIVERVPPPRSTADRPLRALIFDSYYDSYRGVIVYFRVVDGGIKKGDRIHFMASEKDYFADEVGVLSPNQLEVAELYAGEVGYLSASIRSVADARVGDTITHYGRKAEDSLPGYEEVTPMVFCGLFPVDADQFPELRDALEKLQLNDAALKFEPETSSAMGFGFRCGFLGLLHMEIVQERLEREYNLSLITTAPSVVYRVNCVNGDTVECSNPSLLPEPGKRRSIEEPFVKIELLTPKEYIGPLMELAQERRGEFQEMKYITEIRASITYALPLAEMVGDFFDQLKSRSKGYASMEYSFTGYRESELIKLDIQINGDRVEPLATIVHSNKDLFPPQEILLSFLQECDETWKKRIIEVRGSTIQLRRVNEEKLASLKYVLKCLEDHKLDPVKSLPGWKIHEMIKNLEKDIVELEKRMEDSASMKRKTDEACPQKYLSREIKRSRMAASKGGFSVMSYPVNGLLDQTATTFLEDKSCFSTCSSGSSSMQQKLLDGGRAAQLGNYQIGSSLREIGGSIYKMELTPHEFAFKDKSAGQNFFRPAIPTLTTTPTPMPPAIEGFEGYTASNHIDLYHFADAVFESDAPKSSSTQTTGSLPRLQPPHYQNPPYFYN